MTVPQKTQRSSSLIQTHEGIFLVVKTTIQFILSELESNFLLKQQLLLLDFSFQTPQPFARNESNYKYQQKTCSKRRVYHIWVRKNSVKTDFAKAKGKSFLFIVTTFKEKGKSEEKMLRNYKGKLMVKRWKIDENFSFVLRFLRVYYSKQKSPQGLKVSCEKHFYARSQIFRHRSVELFS